MKTLLTILRVGAPPELKEVDLPERPHFEIIREAIAPLIDCSHIEHVSVLHDGRRADMFCDEDFHEKRLPRNDVATAIYRNATLTRQPDIAPETLPEICGTAILSAHRIWF
jgi:hypothetical protein